MKNNLVRVYVVASALLLLALLAMFVLDYVQTRLTRPTAGWEGDRIAIFFFDTYSKPQVVTHVAVADGIEAISAKVDVPIRGESGSYLIDPKTLSWRKSDGNPASVPKPGTPIALVFVEGKYSDDLWFKGGKRAIE